MGIAATATGIQEKGADTVPSCGPQACQLITQPSTPFFGLNLPGGRRPWAGSKLLRWVESSSAELLRDAAGKRLKPSSRRRRHRLCYQGVSPPSLAARTLRARDRKYEGGSAGHVTPEHGRRERNRDRGRRGRDHAQAGRNPSRDEEVPLTALSRRPRRSGMT